MFHHVLVASECKELFRLTRLTEHPRTDMQSDITLSRSRPSHPAGRCDGVPAGFPPVPSPFADVRRSRLAFGTTTLAVDSSGFELLDRAFDLGCTVFDTARIYLDGRSEERLGAWLASRRRHGQAVVVTKGGHPGPQGSRLSAEALEHDVVASLRALRADVLDVFLLHRDDPSLPVEPIVEVLETLKRKGYLRFYGASNWSAARIRTANDYARSRGLSGFSVSSPQFSLGRWANPPWPGCHTISGEAGAEERQWYRDGALALLCWSSLAGGLYTSKSHDAIVRGERPQLPDCYATETNFRMLRRAGEIARAKACSVEAVALAYVLSESAYSCAIFSCTTAESLARNVAALDITLDECERALLRSDQGAP